MTALRSHHLAEDGFDVGNPTVLDGDGVAVGPGRLSEDGKVLPMALAAGDTVLIGKWSGTEVTIDSEEYLILKEDEVLGVLK